MNDFTPKKLEKNEKLKVEDANINDERIPRNLILMYGDTPYIQKAGLEWKANKLFGGGGYSIKVEIIENDRKEKYVLIKATLTILTNNVVFENYGEAHPGNVNTRMIGQLLHLAVTRAECRVLRMATACGYASYDEVMTMPQNGAKDHLQEAIATDKELDKVLIDRINAVKTQEALVAACKEIKSKIKPELQKALTNHYIRRKNELIAEGEK